MQCRIVVQEQNVLPLGLRNHAVVAHTKPDVPVALDQFDLRETLSNKGDGTVSGCIVMDDDLEGKTKDLRKDGFQARADNAKPVVVGDADGTGWVVRRGRIAPRVSDHSHTMSHR